VNVNPIGLPEAINLSFLDFFHYGEAKHDYVTAVRPLFDGLICAKHEARLLTT
jgi:hypothetical protein